jgi:PAS domain S-box-containing protein
MVLTRNPTATRSGQEQSALHPADFTNFSIDAPAEVHHQIESDFSKVAERFRSLVETTSDWIWEVDENGIYTYVSPHVRELLGYGPEEMLGRKPLDFMPAEEARRVQTLFGPITIAQKPFRVLEKTHQHRNGRLVVLETSGVPVFDAGGTFRGYRGVNRDITQRRKREQELVRLAAAVEQTADSIVITDVDGNIEYVNPAFERITGYSEAEALGRNPRILKSGNTPPGVYQDLWRTIKRGDIWVGQLTNRRKDGSCFDELVTISPLRDESGKIVNYVAVKQDRTAQLQLERQLQQSQRLEAIGQLAGGVAHDFNNLLTAILGYSELSLNRLNPDDRIAHNVHEIKKAAERAAALTRQLLAFSRKQILEPRILNLNSVVSDLNKMLRRLIGEDIDLVTRFAGDLKSVKADPSQMEQVLMNLVINARDAMPQGGKLTIETRNATLSAEYALRHQPIQPGEYVVLAVTDTGVGMDAETQTHIFEPFFTTKESGKGTGLGLSTIYGIVKQSGGYIWVHSEVGEGTSFKVYLPRVDAAADPESRQVRGPIEKGNETLLLVEDDSIVRRVTARLLKSAGYTVIEAESGKEALQAVSRHPEIALVITDVVIPEMSGGQLAEKLRRLTPDTRMLFMSGYTDDAVVRAGTVGLDIAFLEKPFTPQTLARKVRDVIEDR